MQTEQDVFINNNTWTLVPWTKEMNAVGNKWVFRVKYNANGTVQRYKARLVDKKF